MMFRTNLKKSQSKKEKMTLPFRIKQLSYETTGKEPPIVDEILLSVGKKRSIRKGNAIDHYKMFKEIEGDDQELEKWEIRLELNQILVLPNTWSLRQRYTALKAQRKEAREATKDYRVTQLMDLPIKETASGVGQMNFYVIKTKGREYDGVRTYNANNEFWRSDVQHDQKYICTLRKVMTEGVKNRQDPSSQNSLFGVGQMNLYVIKTKGREYDGVRTYNANNQFGRSDVQHDQKYICTLRKVMTEGVKNRQDPSSQNSLL
uniref:USP domain-containing protein n=1 Tax=Rhabditophanes sp. KR3021 TaxID=114890 RepID=A0AC35TYA0_9BILA